MASVMSVGAAAWAQGDVPDTTTPQDQGIRSEPSSECISQCMGAPQSSDISEPAEDLGVGGAAEEGTEEMEADLESMPPPEPEPAPAPEDLGTGGSDQSGFTTAPPTSDDDTSVTVVTPAAPVAEPEPMREENDPRGVAVMVGGGVEGYTGDFIDSVNAGPAWDVLANFKPWSALGFELGYTGATNEVDGDWAGSDEGAVGGADLIRNGGHAALVVSAPTQISPYLLGGIGLDYYTYRGADGQLGFQDDTSGSIPVAAGLRTDFGNFTADLRLGFDGIIDDDFAPQTETNVFEGRLKGMLNIGGNF